SFSGCDMQCSFSPRWHICACFKVTDHIKRTQIIFPVKLVTLMANDATFILAGAFQQAFWVTGSVSIDKCIWPISNHAPGVWVARGAVAVEFEAFAFCAEPSLT